MLDFTFTPEQEMVRKTMSEFGKKELAPKAAYWDETGEFPWEQLKKMADLGLLSLRLPPEYGGQGLDQVSLGIVAEELAKHDMTCAFTAVSESDRIALIAGLASEEQRGRWVPPLIRGETVTGLCVTEPGCGSDVAAITTTAVRSGNGYILNGVKASVTRVGVAGVFIVAAKTKREAGARGISLFLVPGDTEGLTRRVYKNLGDRASQRGDLFIDNVRVSADSLLGEENRGVRHFLAFFDASRPRLALLCLGCAQAALEDAIKYAKERVAFGQPIGKFEGVSFLFAEDATLIEACRLLAYKALWLRDAGLSNTKESAMVKWWGPEVALETIHHSILIHGHMGYTEELPQARRLRDVIGFEIADAAAQIQKVVIARELLGREFLPY